MRSKKKFHNKNRNNKVVEIPSPKVEEEEIQIIPVPVPIETKNEVSKNLKTETTTVEPSRPAPVTTQVVLEDVIQPLEVVSIPEVVEDIKQPTEVVSTPKDYEDVKRPPEVVSTPEVLENMKQPPNIVSLPEVHKDIKRPLEVILASEVLEDIKHPLENTWSIWLNTNHSKNWTENQKNLISFDTVEDYWCLYHHMKLPSEQRQGQDFAVFKQGISPMWEDDANKAGGRWLINLDRRGGGEMDRIWVDVVLLMIGENFPNNDAIRGAVVNVKPKSRVSVWTRSKAESENMEIGKKMKEILRLNFKIQFLDHKSNVTLYTI